MTGRSVELVLPAMWMLPSDWRAFAAAISDGWPETPLARSQPQLDGDIEKDMVKRFHVEGYPTIIALDPSGKETKRFRYLSSRAMLEALGR